MHVWGGMWGGLARRASTNARPRRRARLWGPNFGWRSAFSAAITELNKNPKRDRREQALEPDFLIRSSVKARYKTLQFYRLS